MAAGTVPPPDMPVDFSRLQSGCDRRAEQQMIEPQAGVTAEGIPEIIPESIDRLARMQRPR